MDPLQSARELAKSIQQSTEYHNFQKAYKELKEDSAASSIFNDLRNLQMEMQQLQAQGEELPSEKEEKLNKIAEAANYNKTVKSFIEAETNFANIIKDIQQIIADAIDVEDD